MSRKILLPQSSQQWSREPLVVRGVSFANEADFYSRHNHAFNENSNRNSTDPRMVVITKDSQRVLVSSLLLWPTCGKNIAKTEFNTAKETYGYLLPTTEHVFTNEVFSLQQVDGQSVLIHDGKPVLTCENMHTVAAETLRELADSKEFQNILDGRRKPCEAIIKTCLIPVLSSRFSYYRAQSFGDFLVPPRAQPQAKPSQPGASIMAHGNGTTPFSIPPALQAQPQAEPLQIPRNGVTTLYSIPPVPSTPATPAAGVNTPATVDGWGRQCASGQMVRAHSVNRRPGTPTLTAEQQIRLEELQLEREKMLHADRIARFGYHTQMAISAGKTVDANKETAIAIQTIAASADAHNLRSTQLEPLQEESWQPGNEEQSFSGSSTYSASQGPYLLEEECGDKDSIG